MIKAGTSIGPNVEEALGGFSKGDFSYKMSVALKEAKESNYWLRLSRDSKLIEDPNLELLINESEEMKKILTAIVKTSQEKK